MEKKAINREAIAVLIVFPIISTILAKLISIMEKQTNTTFVILLLVSIIFFLPIFLFIGESIFGQVASSTIEEKISEEIKSIQVRSANNRIVDGIYKEEQLALMERTTFFEEIWLISPDLLTEINSGIYADIVSENLKKGTKYKYFVPDNAVNRTRVKIFKKKCNNSNLKVYYLDDDFFFIVPHVDFAIYEPMKSVTDGKQGYIGLPLVGSKDSFAALMNNDFVDAVIGKLAEKINSTE